MPVDHATWDRSLGNESLAPWPHPLLGPHSWLWLWECRNDKMPRDATLGCKRLSVIVVSSRYMPRGAQDGGSCNSVIATWRCCHTGVQSFSVEERAQRSHSSRAWRKLAEQGYWWKKLAVKHSRIAQDVFTALTRDSSCLYSVEALLLARCDQRDICFWVNVKGHWISQTLGWVSMSQACYYGWDLLEIIMNDSFPLS